jgi:hypothetical protein
LFCSIFFYRVFRRFLTRGVQKRHKKKSRGNLLSFQKKHSLTYVAFFFFFFTAPLEHMHELAAPRSPPCMRHCVKQEALPCPSHNRVPRGLSGQRRGAHRPHRGSSDLLCPRTLRVGNEATEFYAHVPGHKQSNIPWIRFNYCFGV